MKMENGVLQGNAKVCIVYKKLYLISNKSVGRRRDMIKIVSEYDQEIPQSQTANKPMAS